MASNKVVGTPDLIKTFNWDGTNPRYAEPSASLYQDGYSAGLLDLPLATNVNFIYKEFKMNCFADDTGLEIESLAGRPGVHSASYAGEERNSLTNMNRVLEELRGVENRNARFKTVITLIIEGEQHIFEGIVNGRIIDEKRGKNGFGYDPIFIPENESKTFAEMDLSEKNKFSHRAKALKKMIEFLRQ
jgi:XTP/dITP diphosphohydrolase